mmetsp:Transcript_19639/g.75404  ORF Transcript_19639/g.75404 Transcript_19639/m.75404 type:complete len:201 (+) Transcript_19639:2182-2784(+)
MQPPRQAAPQPRRRRRTRTRTKTKMKTKTRIAMAAVATRELVARRAGAPRPAAGSSSRQPGGRRSAAPPHPRAAARHRRRGHTPPRSSALSCACGLARPLSRRWLSGAGMPTHSQGRPPRGQWAPPCLSRAPFRWPSCSLPRPRSWPGWGTGQRWCAVRPRQGCPAPWSTTPSARCSTARPSRRAQRRRPSGCVSTALPR